MILTLSNIGKISNAQVEIKGITVIAGENNTGKSTVGKALYSFFKSFFELEEQIHNERYSTIEVILNSLQRDIMKDDFFILFNDEFLIKKILTDKQSDEEKIKAIILSGFNDSMDESSEVDIDEEVVNAAIKKIIDVLMVTDEEIINKVLTKQLRSEFNSQINNLYSGKDGYIELKVKNNSARAMVVNDVVKNVSHVFHFDTDVIYIDDPFVVDEPLSSYFMLRGNWGRKAQQSGHRECLKRKLFLYEKENSVIDEIIANRKLDYIYEKINSICAGEIVKESRAAYGYKKSGSDKVLNLKNISTGLKTFVIIKTLLKNGGVVENGTIILDEPEIHLHPEWQVLFAEIIVLIQKQFNMHILLNTHSPYFLSAIQVYSEKHGIADKCKYYMATVKDDSARIEDVTNNLETIYSKLAKPFQDLENERSNYVCE